MRDAATGQVRTELGAWSLLPVLRPDDPLVGVRRGADGRMVVAELDLVAGRARIVDVLPGIAGSCQASLPVLLCQRLDGTTASVAVDAVSDSVIDLGELRHGTDPEPMPRPPRAHGRQLRCALVVLLALVTLAASAVVTAPAGPGDAAGPARVRRHDRW